MHHRRAPTPPLISSLPPALSAPIYLLSPTLPVTQQLRPANPFWKETTEQKITSPPLSHTPSLPFVFSSGLLLTSLHHHHHRAMCLSLPLPLPVFLIYFETWNCTLKTLWGKLWVFTSCYILPLRLFSGDVIGWFLNLSQTWLNITDPAKQILSKPGGKITPERERERDKHTESR